jgi:hypothetical protein
MTTDGEVVIVQENEAQMKKKTAISINYAILFSAILVVFFASGGLVVTIIEDQVDSIAPEATVLATVIAAALVLVVLCSRYLLKDLRGSGSETRRVFFNIVLFGLLSATTLVSLNIAASFFAVKWPMSGLHGVGSDVGKRAWEYHENIPGFVNVNSWGQRDREHALEPAPGVRRIIFLGDSMLEHGAPIPLPVKTEMFLNSGGKKSYEVINLGVSATDTDEYYYRLKGVGLPLKPEHCVLVFSAQTDFIQAPTLLSYYGISSTYPRLSFLQLLGLRSLDQVISNERRLILRAWFKGGALLQHELELKDQFGKTRADRETEELYLSFFPPNEQQRLKTVLAGATEERRHLFFSMLRSPDQGSFFSFYLDLATKLAKGTEYSPSFIPAEYSFLWVKAVKDLCRKNSLKFTLVVAPVGFDVDSRMTECYSAIADMNAYMKFRDDATTRLVSHAKAEGMDVVDLRELLRNYTGTYLNMDGHWSQKGVDVVAQYLANRFEGKEAGSH